MGVRSNLKQLSKDTAFYGLGSTIQKFIGFFLFPIYTRLLTPEAFGAQDLILSFTTIVSYFLILGLDSATARHYYDAETLEDQRTILSTWFWFELIIIIPVTLFLLVFAEPISVFFFTDKSLAQFLRLGVMALPFTLLASISMLTLRLHFRSKEFSIISVSGVLVQAFSAIVLVVILQMGLRGVFIANLIASIFRASIGLALTNKNFKRVLSLSWLKPMLAYGIPLVPASMSLWILNYSNRYFLVRAGTLGDIGMLSVATRIASILALALTAFQIAWGPFAFSLLKQEEVARQTYSKALTYLLLIALPLAVVIAVFAREGILILATSKYESAAPLVPWLCYGMIAWASSYIVGIGYSIVKKSYHTSIRTFIGALFNIGLNILLIPFLGILGAAISTMIGNIITFIYSYFAGQHFFPIKYEYARIFILFGLCTSTIIAGSLIDMSWVYWSPEILIYKSLISILFIGSLFVLKIIKPEEVSKARIYIFSKRSN